VSVSRGIRSAEAKHRITERDSGSSKFSMEIDQSRCGSSRLRGLRGRNRPSLRGARCRGPVRWPTEQQRCQGGYAVHAASRRHLTNTPDHFGGSRFTWTRELLCRQMRLEGFPWIAVCTMGRCLARSGDRSSLTRQGAVRCCGRSGVANRDATARDLPPGISPIRAYEILALDLGSLI
jgi:hypothetical protein